MLRNAEFYKNSLEKSNAWLLTQINPDGTVNPASKGSIAYYKLPWALILAGKTLEAKKIIDWNVRENMTPNGDFKSDKRQKFALDFYIYPNAWLCLASHLLSLFDISYPAWKYIATHQDPNTGGYCGRSPYNPDRDNLQDAISTAWSSIVGLHLGKLEQAINAGKFLKMLLEIQPDFQREFYYYWYPQKGLVVEKPAEESDKRFIRINIEEKEENFYYILGAIIAFLAKLFLVTRDKQHLDSAKAYYDFVLRAGEKPFHTESCGKLCYASLHLYHATEDLKYLEMAEKFMDSLLGIGEAEGFWIRNGSPTVSSTAEFCVWRHNLLFIEDGHAKS